MPVESKRKPKSQFLILYGSETGTAKGIAEEIASKALAAGLRPSCFCLSLVDKRFNIDQETCIIFVVSTTGIGQPPEAAKKFDRRLCKKTLGSTYLEHLNFTLLALGDSNYLQFAAFGRRLEARLKSLSAKSFYPTGYGDDAFGFEATVEPWIDNLWPSLYKHLGLKFHKDTFVEAYNLLNNVDTNSRFQMNSSSDIMKESDLEDTKDLSSLSSALKKTDFEKFHVPKFPQPSYIIGYHRDSQYSSNFPLHVNKLVLPASPLVNVSLIYARKLTEPPDVKDKLELTFKFQDEVIEYEPGDAFGFLCPNDETEVETLLTRLDCLDVADVSAYLAPHKENSHQKKIPAHIPHLFSIKELLLYYIEIRAVPKKILLRIFAEYTDNEEEKQGLLFLSSQEGSNHFSDLIRKPSLSVADILDQFKSCKPPIERIIEYLPPLKPRFYSVASSPLVDGTLFKIVFSAVKIQSGDGRSYDRQGVCTGWLTALASDMFHEIPYIRYGHSISTSSLNEMLSAMKLHDRSKSIFVYKRKNQFFKFPNDMKTPIIMVGPGTGVAPFIGYLQHREKLMQANSKGNSDGETWLFYGCRYPERDYLYRNELERLVEKKVLNHLVLSFSREDLFPEQRSKYVHESIKLHAHEISSCIQAGGKVFVCGDAKHMVHDVQQAFLEVIHVGLGMSEQESKKFLESLQKEQRYANDVWA